MLNETISLSEQYPKATLTTYVWDDKPDLRPPRRPAIVVCPGGGYVMLSQREAEPIVSRFLGNGFNVFLLMYSIYPEVLKYEPVTEAARSIAHIRKNADKYNIDPDRIFIVGFSAGGHLAASSGILWNCDALKKEFEGQPEGIGRPNGMILAYPVISGGEFGHKGSIKKLSGDETLSPETLAEWSLELHVDSTTPPAFIWHTVTDKAVPVQNSLLLAEAMTKNNGPYELHIFPEGPHGLALANEETANGNPDMIRPNVERWVELAVEWTKGIK